MLLLGISPFPHSTSQVLCLSVLDGDISALPPVSFPWEISLSAHWIRQAGPTISVPTCVPTALGHGVILHITDDCPLRIRREVTDHRLMVTVFVGIALRWGICSSVTWDGGLPPWGKEETHTQKWGRREQWQRWHREKENRRVLQGCEATAS